MIAGHKHHAGRRQEVVMPKANNYHRTPKETLIQSVKAFRIKGSVKGAAESLGISDATLARHLAAAAIEGMIPKGDLPQTSLTQAKNRQRAGYRRYDALFEQPDLPDEGASIDELLERRKAEYARKARADEARKLIPVKVKLHGPIGIVHMGDPHVDDPGTDIAAMERHIRVVNDTEGMVAANVGDLQNNWVGRLARLYGEQSTSAADAWRLTEWLVGSTDWLYLIGGNHDCWSGAGDPLKWIASHHGQAFEPWGARLNLLFPNGKQVRINARHDFAGHSMWNTAHGPMKAVQAGWRDHILTCGHKHTSGYGLLKDPSNGLISHAIRVAGYKVLDRYAKELGLPNQNITPASVTIIDPQFDDDDPRLITVLHDVEEAADYLTFKRGRA
jgi:hypothetical protein